MADDDTGDEVGKGKKAKTPADEKRREQVLVGAAVAGVILTVLLLRKSSSNAAAPLPVSAPVGNTGGGSNGVSSGDFMSLQNQVYGLQGTLSGLEATLGMTSSPTGISSNPTPGKFTGADVEDLFQQHGLTIGPDQGETAQQREDRIVRQLNSGTRTPSQVSNSIAHLPGAV